MSDEDINNDILEDGDNQEELSNDESPSDNPSTSTSITYCTEEDIVNLFGGNVSDTIETDLITGAIETATARIHNRLRANRVPLPDPNNYASAIQSEILDEYIDAYLNTCADEEEQYAVSPVGHRRALSYNEKRKRRGWY